MYIVITIFFISILITFQGHSRRILTQVKPISDSGTLPIICEAHSLVSIGGVCARSRLQKGLDSYQEEDLNILRVRWNDALDKRREYLDEQLQQIMNKQGTFQTCQKIYLFSS